MKLLVIFIIFYSCSAQLTKFSTGIMQKNNVLNDMKWINSYNDYKLSEHDSVGNTFSYTVIFGLWCHDSRREIPRLLKVLEGLSVPEENINLIAIDKKKTTPLDSINKYKVHFTPTIVVNYHGKEVERFVEYPHSKWETDLIGLFRKYREEKH